MISEKYLKLDQELFKISRNPDKRLNINNINQYNLSEGLALNDDEIIYLESLSKKIGRKLTDSEVFGFLKSTLSIAGTKYSMEDLLLTR